MRQPPELAMLMTLGHVTLKAAALGLDKRTVDQDRKEDVTTTNLSVTGR
jgi:hypothetical protein